MVEIDAGEISIFGEVDLRELVLVEVKIDEVGVLGEVDGL